MTRHTEQARADLLGSPVRVVGLGRHHSVELRGVTEQNDDGVDRQEILRACKVGEELTLARGTNHSGNPESLRILRKSGVELGFVTPHTEVAQKLEEGRKFRVKLAKIYPYRGHGGMQGAVLDFEEVSIFPVRAEGTGLATKWIVVIGIVTLLIAGVAAKLLGIF